jgi:hypothetical protein
MKQVWIRRTRFIRELMEPEDLQRTKFLVKFRVRKNGPNSKLIPAGTELSWMAHWDSVVRLFALAYATEQRNSGSEKAEAALLKPLVMKLNELLPEKKLVIRQRRVRKGRVGR